VGLPAISGYVASKHGVVGLTKSAALDYAATGIRINAICPGVIDTPLVSGLSEEQVIPVAAAHPMGRIGVPTEIADAALWLCGPGASFVTGVSLSVDGGYVLP
jgi:NAD(P)-dependent dehydrogenase (short-subunit alcohol dehydrogenase family)